MRADRYAARSWLWRRSKIKPISHCGRVPLGQDVALRRTATDDGGFVAGIAGVVTCGSVWACPVCSAKISGRRAEQIQDLLYRWKSQTGGRVVMLTFTVRHNASDSLKSVWDAVSKGWRAASNGKHWDALQRVHGTPMVSRGVERHRVPLIRVVEVTHGKNGWHVHVHALALVNANTTAEDVDGITRTLWGRWNAAVERAGFAGGSFAACEGHLVTPGTETNALSEYFTKAVYEVTLGATKDAHGDNLTPFGILRSIMRHRAGELELDDAEFLRLVRAWGEWEQGSRGRRQLSYSHGLREFLNVGDQGTDEEIASEVAGTVEDTVAVIDGDTWRGVWSFGLLTQLLDATELEGHAGAVRVLETARVMLERYRDTFGPPA